jgi:peptidoglycan/LPS O-acetylase OafA/YrhL
MEFTDQLSNYHLFKQEPLTWNMVVNTFFTASGLVITNISRNRRKAVGSSCYNSLGPFSV